GAAQPLAGAATAAGGSQISELAASRRTRGPDAGAGNIPMSNPPTLPLVLAVVGHTNTGKTSLLRTLLRNANFGEVHDSAGTTRHVEAAQLLLQGKPYIELRDTPGLEDSVALAAQLKNTQQQGLRGRAC